MTLAENNEPIKRAVAVIKELSADELAHEQAEIIERSRRDAQARIRHHHKLGVEEGLEQGREQGLKQTARAMLAKGFDMDDISEITGLDQDTITKL